MRRALLAARNADIVIRECNQNVPCVDCISSVKILREPFQVDSILLPLLASLYMVCIRDIRLADDNDEEEEEEEALRMSTALDWEMKRGCKARGNS